MGKLTPEQKRKIKEQIKREEDRLHTNKQNFNAGLKDIEYKIKVKGHDMEDCDSRINDLKKKLNKKEITEAYFNQKEAIFKNKKSKHRATLFALEQKKETKTREYYTKQANIERKIKELKNKLNS